MINALIHIRQISRLAAQEVRETLSIFQNRYQVEYRFLFKPQYRTATDSEPHLARSHKGGFLRLRVDMKFRTSSGPKKGAECKEEDNKSQVQFKKAKAAFRKLTGKRSKAKPNSSPAIEIDCTSSTIVTSDPPPAPPTQSSDLKAPEKVSMTLMETSTTTTSQHTAGTSARRHSGGSIPRAGGGRRKSGGGKKFHGGRFKQRPSKDHLSFDDPASRMYEQIPLLEVTKLPRGGISIETEAVGRVQVSLFG